MLKFFAILSSTHSHNYFDSPTKLFSNLYLAKFLDTSTKPFFPCVKSVYLLPLTRALSVNNSCLCQDLRVAEVKKAVRSLANVSRENVDGGIRVIFAALSRLQPWFSNIRPSRNEDRVVCGMCTISWRDERTKDRAMQYGATRISSYCWCFSCQSHLTCIAWCERPFINLKWAEIIKVD